MAINITAPAGFAPMTGLAFDDGGGAAIKVGGATPLPVSAQTVAARAVPLAGTMAASGAAGPFVPDLDRRIYVTLSGDFAGTVRLLRSTDGGATRLPLTVAGRPWGRFTGPVNEAVWTESEAGATLYLSAQLTGGTLTYRVSQ